MAAKKREAAPPVQLAELEKSLEQDLAKAYVLRGDEGYFRDQAIDLIVRAATARGFEVCRHDATGYPRSSPEFELARLFDDLGAQPLFASARCIVVRGADPLLKKDGRKDSAAARALLAFVEDEKREGTLVVAGSGLRADAAICKAVVAAGGVSISCRKLWADAPPWDPDPRKAELVQWFAARARTAGVRVSADDALYVVASVGNDLSALETELEKLRRAGPAGVRTVVGWNAGAAPYEVAELLLDGDAKRATAGVVDLFRGGFKGRDGKREVGADALTAMLLNSLSKGARQVLRAAEEMRDGGSPKAAAEAAGVAKSARALERLEVRLGARDQAEWRRVLDEITELERRTRTGGTVDEKDFLRLILALRLRRRALGGGRPTR